MARPSVVFQPAVYRAMQRGINQVVEAVRPTLGPAARTVVVSQVMSQKTPEVLDDGGAIARRIAELRGRGEDMGAMLIRQALWRVREQVGDGTATAAVLFQAVFNQGVRYVAAGGNAVRLRHYLEQGAAAIAHELDHQMINVGGKVRLAAVADAICHDRELSRVLGEIFDIIGEYGQLDIRAGHGRTVDREYVEGVYWERGVISRAMLAGAEDSRVELLDGAVLLSDLKFDSSRDLGMVLAAAMQAGLPGVLLIGSDFSDEVKSFLLANRHTDKFRVIAVRAPGSVAEDQSAALEDLAVLTGGTPFYQAAGQSLRSLRPEHLGCARRIWATVVHFGIVAGKGDPRLLRRHIAALRERHRQAAPDQQRKIQQRLGKLLGGSATLYTGGMTELEINMRKELAQRTADALRGAVRDGVVLGGGVALLRCQSALRAALKPSDDADARAAIGILSSALEAPLRTIVANAGHDASAVLADLSQAEPGSGFDVRSGQVVNMAEAGILDVASVLKTAVTVAIYTAALALTVDVLVQHREPQVSLSP